MILLQSKPMASNHLLACWHVLHSKLTNQLNVQDNKNRIVSFGCSLCLMSLLQDTCIDNTFVIFVHAPVLSILQHNESDKSLFYYFLVPNYLFLFCLKKYWMTQFNIREKAALLTGQNARCFTALLDMHITFLN